jgi:hypothetical protein
MGKAVPARPRQELLRLMTRVRPARRRRDRARRRGPANAGGLLELFPVAYHEPYFPDYVRHDLAALFAGLGLEPRSAERDHMSKIMTFDKPGNAARRCACHSASGAGGSAQGK